MTRTLIVSVEPLWPEVHGGRLRTARLAETLVHHGHRVTVAAPSHGEVGPAPSSVSTLTLGTWSAGRPAKLRAALSPRPRIGVLAVGGCQGELAEMASGFDVVVWAHAYLAAVAGPLTGPIGVIDVANVESVRFRSMAVDAALPQRMSRLWEAAKASRWEPAAWRVADVCIALGEEDARLVRTAVDGAPTRVVVGANGVDEHAYVPSPEDPVAVLVASYRYEPNVAAARWVVREVWPDVRSRFPSARLVLAGRSALSAVGDLASSGSGVEVVSDFADPRPVYEKASVVLAPVRSGGGYQLKVSEALSHHRVVVSSPYSASSMPVSVSGSGAIVVADSASEWVAALCGLFGDPVARRCVEAGLTRPGVVPTWSVTLRDAIVAIDAAVGGAR